MKTLCAFIKKEFVEICRTSKITILGIVFVLFGIMNPAIAKLTPWMMEMMAGSLKESGLSVTKVEVNAMVSWTQFYKNIPIALIVFILIFSGILTVEYQRGTLINMLTKGLQRWKVICAKSFVMILMWTVCYWGCFAITYGYNAYFWDNSIALHLGFATFCYYIFGIWFISIIMLASSLVSSNSLVLAITGGAFVVSYVCGLLRVMQKYVPTELMASNSLLVGQNDCDTYFVALLITAGLIVLNYVISILCFNKKML